MDSRSKAQLKPSRFDDLPRGQKRGAYPHRAQVFHEGWAIECECGYTGFADTRAGVEELHVLHIDPYRTHLATTTPKGKAKHEQAGAQSAVRTQNRRQAG